jgi:hypothetical protein
MSYASDFGRAEREYYTPREDAEGEYEGTRTVFCKNESCEVFEVEVDADLIITYYGTSGSAVFTCPICNLVSEHEFELDESEIGGYYDTDEDWRHDK